MTRDEIIHRNLNHPSTRELLSLMKQVIVLNADRIKHGESEADMAVRVIERISTLRHDELILAFSLVMIEMVKEKAKRDATDA